MKPSVLFASVPLARVFVFSGRRGADPYRHKGKNLLAMITYPQHRRGGVSPHAHIVYHSEAYKSQAFSSGRRGTTKVVDEVSHTRLDIAFVVDEVFTPHPS